MNEFSLSHNLNIKIVNENNEFIENKLLLESIYNEFIDKKIIKKGHMLNRDFKIILYWKKMSITKIEEKLMGNIFIISSYSDKVLYEATKILLNDIENKLKLETNNKNWKIVFHISKLLENIDKKYELKIL